MADPTSYPSFQVNNPPPLLKNCVEKLDPKKIAAIEKSSVLWRVIGKITPFAYTIFAVGSFIACGLLAPFYLPVASLIATISLAGIAEPFRKNCLSYATQSQEIANEQRALKTQTEALPRNIEELRIKLNSLFIRQQILNLSREEDLIELRPLIALYEHQTQITNKIQADVRISEAQALELMNNNPSSPDLTIRRAYTIILQDVSLTQKVTTAFTRAVLLRPWFQGSLENLSSLNKTDGVTRALANEFNDPTANDFILFKDEEATKLSRSDVQNMPITGLADRLIAIIDHRHSVVIAS